MPNENDVSLSPEQWCLVQTLLLEGALERKNRGRDETARKIMDEIVPEIAAVARSDVLDAATKEVRESLGLPTDPP